MMGVFYALCAVKLFAAGFPFSLYERELAGLAMATFTAATLPVYMLFANTRYTATAPRWAFGAAVSAHLIFQIITMVIVHEQGFRNDAAGTVAKLGAALMLAVPAWVLYRQRVLTRRTLIN